MVTSRNPTGGLPDIFNVNVGVVGVVELGSRAKRIVRKAPSGSGRRKSGHCLVAHDLVA
jgi:hypothetical protein